ncbi:ABATE domain-containing protein [Achromobacter denitrificans]
MLENATAQKAPLFVGDDLALDFINSEFGVGLAHHECFTDDHAVLAWLKLAGVLPHGIEAPPEGLMKLALQLRENAKSLLNAAKLGERPTPASSTTFSGPAVARRNWSGTARATRSRW